MGKCRRFQLITVCLVVGLTLLSPLFVQSAATAQSNQQGFSLQVTPSPLVATIKPGQRSELELRIRNTSTEAQSLQMGLRTFTVDENSGAVQLGDGAPDEVKDFVSFSQPSFRLEPGAITTQKIRIDTPRSAGFSYTFATTISRQTAERPNPGGAAIQGSVAVFTLLSVDRPGAQRKFELAEFTSEKRVYEYLPANFNLKLKNSGNTLVQPKGNIFIQRSGNDEALATLQINDAGGYILPGSNRSLTSTWSDGFPRYETTDSGNGGSKKDLKWHWDNASKFRFGKYTAKVVAIYDDGQRDVPVTTELSFWVIPWKIIAIGLLVLAILCIGLYSVFRRSALFIKKVKPHAKKDTTPK